MPVPRGDKLTPGVLWHPAAMAPTLPITEQGSCAGLDTGSEGTCGGGPPGHSETVAGSHGESERPQPGCCRPLKQHRVLTEATGIRWRLLMHAGSWRALKLKSICLNKAV